MNFIHDRTYLSRGDTVIVQCDTQCNVRVTSDGEFAKFCRGASHQMLGGFYKRFPAVIVVPSAGYWNVTIDLGGGRANIRYNISYRKEQRSVGGGGSGGERGDVQGTEDCLVCGQPCRNHAAYAVSEWADATICAQCRADHPDGFDPDECPALISYMQENDVHPTLNDEGWLVLPR